MKRAPTIAFLLGLAVFIVIRLATGQIHLYLLTPMTGLLCATVFFLLLIVWSYGMQPEASPPSDQVDGTDSHCACDQGHEHHHDHDEATAACACGHGTSWLQTCLMGVPFVIGLLIPPQPLGSSALANRSLNRTASRRAGVVLPAQESPTDKNLYQWAVELGRNGDPASASGQFVRVTGFVYRDDRCDSNTFVIARFVMTCCTADASPVGFSVHWPEANAFNKDEWVTVTGHFGVTTRESRPIAFIQADAVDTVERPSRPYLSPWGP